MFAHLGALRSTHFDPEALRSARVLTLRESKRTTADWRAKPGIPIGANEFPVSISCLSKLVPGTLSMKNATSGTAVAL
jgi:hypothetical protein